MIFVYFLNVLFSYLRIIFILLYLFIYLFILLSLFFSVLICTVFTVIWHVHQVLLKFIRQWSCWVNKRLLVRPLVNYCSKHYIYCFFVCVRSSWSGIFVIPSCNLNPLNPKIKIGILICSPYSFPSEVMGEKLIKHQTNSSCVIMSVILMTTLFYKALILQREIWCWSLLGLKGLRT